MDKIFEYNDGGRKEAGYKGTAGDCVVRSIAIVSQLPYQAVYDDLNDSIKNYRGKTARKSSARSGVVKNVYKKYIEKLGFKWFPCVTIGSGCKVHLVKSELPEGRLIIRCSKHLTAMIDGCIHDIYDPSRNGTRCVYGYWKKVAV